MIGRDVLYFVYPFFALTAHSILVGAFDHNHTGVSRAINDLEKRVAKLEVVCKIAEPKKIIKR